MSPDNYVKWATGRRREGHRRVQGGPRQPQVGRQGRKGHATPARPPACRERPRSSSTASSSTARSRSTTSRRRSTRSSRRRRRRSPRARRSTRIYVEMSKENKKNAPAAKDEDEGEKEDTKTVFKVPVGTSPVQGNPNALVTIDRVLRLPVPVLQPRRADAQGRQATSTATRSASSGRTSRSPSTRPPSPPPRRRWRSAPRRATRASGTCTTRFFAAQKDLMNGKDAERRRDREDRDRRRRERRQGEERDHEPYAQEGDRRRQGAVARTSRRAARRTSSSTAGASSARSPRRSSRRSSTKRSRRRRTSSPRARSRARSTRRSSRTARARPRRR